MTKSNTVISPDGPDGKACRPSQSLQQRAAAGPRLAIDQSDIFAPQVFDASDILGIPRSNNESLLPAGKSNDRHISIRKLATDERQVELRAFRILKMRSGDVNFSFLQPVERQLTGRRRMYDLDAAEPLHHAREQTRRRIAASQNDFIAHAFLLG